MRQDLVWCNGTTTIKKRLQSKVISNYFQYASSQLGPLLSSFVWFVSPTPQVVQSSRARVRCARFIVSSCATSPSACCCTCSVPVIPTFHAAPRLCAYLNLRLCCFSCRPLRPTFDRLHMRRARKAAARFPILSFLFVTLIHAAAPAVLD